MERKLIIAIVIVLIVLAIFLFPKSCGNWGTAVGAEYKQCNCIGLKINSFTIGGGPVACYGIPVSEYCYKMDNVDESIQKIDIPCE